MKQFIFIFVALLGLSGLLQPAQARSQVDTQSYRNVAVMRVAAESSTVSPQEAARKAKARYGGKVLSVDLKRSKEGAAYYRVKLLSEGNVRVVRISAEK